MLRSSKSWGFIRDLLSVIIRSVVLNFDSIDVEAGKRQKIALAKELKIGKSFFWIKLNQHKTLNLNNSIYM